MFSHLCLTWAHLRQEAVSHAEHDSWAFPTPGGPRNNPHLLQEGQALTLSTNCPHKRPYQLMSVQSGLPRAFCYVVKQHL